MCTNLFLSTCAKIRTRCRCPRTRSRPCTRALIKVGTGSLCAPAFPLFPRSFTRNQLLHIPITPCYAPFAKMVSAEGAKWTKDNLGTQSVDKVPLGGGGHPDPEIRRMPGLKKIFFRPFASQFGLKIRGRAPRAPPLDPPLIFVTVPGLYSPGTKCEGTLSLLLTSHVNLNSNFRIRYSFFLSVYPWP